MIALLAALFAEDRAVGAALTAAKAYIIHAVFTERTGVAEISFAAHTVTTDSAVETDFAACTAGTFFTAFFAYIGTVGASLTAVCTDVIHTGFTEAAGIAEADVTARTVTAGTAFGTQFLRSAVGAFFSAVLADHFSALVASVSAGTKSLHALTALAAFGTEFAARTVKTAITPGTQLIVSTVFAFFAARYADVGAVGTSVAAVADLIHTIFTQSAPGAVVSLTADTGEADAALDAQLLLGTVRTFFSAFGTDIRTFRASVAAGADIFHTHFA